VDRLFRTWPTATPSTTFSDYQMSEPPPKKPRPNTRGSKYSPPERLEIVRLQWSMVHEDIRNEGCDVESWNLAHLLEDCIHPVMKERTLTIRYEDGHVEDVCAGAVHRPEQALRIHTGCLTSRAAAECACSSPADGTPPPRPDPSPLNGDQHPSITEALASHVRREYSPPLPRDGHASSMDDDSSNDYDRGNDAASGNEDNPAEAESASDASDVTLTERQGKSPSPAMSEVECSVRLQTLSSEATLSDCESGRGKRMTRVMHRGHMHGVRRGSRYRAARERARRCVGARNVPFPAVGGTVFRRQHEGGEAVGTRGPIPTRRANLNVPEISASGSSSSDS
jgi:hypothetical protein